MRWTIHCILTQNWLFRVIFPACNLSSKMEYPNLVILSVYLAQGKHQLSH